jgi:ribosomal protein S18 acetylase RimI-like enzyme
VTTVRRGTAADTAALARIARETFVDAFGADNGPEDMAVYVSKVFGEAQQSRELADPDIVTLVAGEDAQLATGNGQLIAYAQLRRTPGSPHGEVELARFYVRRAHHGQGLAQTLMSAVVDEARALGGTRLWLGVWERNARAIAFYRKCGFVEVGAQPFLLGNDLQRDLVMQRTNL